MKRNFSIQQAYRLTSYGSTKIPLVINCTNDGISQKCPSNNDGDSDIISDWNLI